MSKPKFESEEPLTALMRLLEQIVEDFGDAYSRPCDQIELYRRYVELGRNHKVRLAGPFIVIDGKGDERPPV